MDKTVVEKNVERGTLEAYDTSKIFRFVDDVVVRVRRDAGNAGATDDGEDDGETVIDVRSTSRVGLGDRGYNANRIRAFAARLTDE